MGIMTRKINQSCNFENCKDIYSGEMKGDQNVYIVEVTGYQNSVCVSVSCTPVF